MSLGTQAFETLRSNDYGGYAVPTKDLYPFQWNWDSAIHALGFQAAGEERRAWQEVETLLACTWENGLLPHIIFHQPSETYFPGPSVWGTPRTPITSAISQPPLVGYAVMELYRNSPDKEGALFQLRQLAPALIRHMRWWTTARWDAARQLTFTVHPWESGRDNSPMYDEALSAVPPIDATYTRRDTTLIEADERPHQYEYDRYMYLVQFYQKAQFDDTVIAAQSPYKVCDAGLNAILARSIAAVLSINTLIGGAPLPDLEQRLAELKDGFAHLWSARLNTYCGYDLIADRLIEIPAAEGFFAMFGKVAPPANVKLMEQEIRRWLALTKYGVAGVAPDSPKWEPRRYCRGPVWVIINWLIATGLAEHGFANTAATLHTSATELVTQYGFSEYYDPRDGSPCGGSDFSWTAALAMHWLRILP